MTRPVRSFVRIFLMGVMPLGIASAALAQDAPVEQPTIFSVKASAGFGLGRSRQEISKDVWWSSGQGVKMDLGLDLPLIPVDVVDSLGSTSGTVPIVGLELEASTGYHLSAGGATTDADPSHTGALINTSRIASYVPVLLGLNVRTNFGGGLPSVYVGAGGGIYLIGLYEESVSSSFDGASFTRKMHPPLPFALYGSLGFELPLMYDQDAGNSMIDLFTEFRLTEMSVYVYDYDVYGSDGKPVLTLPENDPTLIFKNSQRSASNISLSLGIKYNLY